MSGYREVSWFSPGGTPRGRGLRWPKWKRVRELMKNENISKVPTPNKYSIYKPRKWLCSCGRVWWWELAGGSSSSKAPPWAGHRHLLFDLKYKKMMMMVLLLETPCSSFACSFVHLSNCLSVRLRKGAVLFFLASLGILGLFGHPWTKETSNPRGLNWPKVAQKGLQWPIMAKTLFEVAELAKVA